MSCVIGIDGKGKVILCLILPLLWRKANAREFKPFFYDVRRNNDNDKFELNKEAIIQSYRIGGVGRGEGSPPVREHQCLNFQWILYVHEVILFCCQCKTTIQECWCQFGVYGVRALHIHVFRNRNILHSGFYEFWTSRIWGFRIWAFPNSTLDLHAIGAATCSTWVKVFITRIWFFLIDFKL